ncbi:MAG TPA: MFS transporter [Pirellulales bacterium]|nr:MFS transporter [Pirellulales bacterium]
MAASTAVASNAPAPPLSFSVGWRLSLMMFLQYAIWGAWLPLLWPYLGYLGISPPDRGTIIGIGAVGAIFAPFIAGQIADRFFPTQWFLGISHLLGAVLVWQLASLTKYNQFLWFSLAYSILFAPTLSLTNSLAFHHIPDRNRDFGKVRIWGTIGWIVAGIGVAQWLFFHYTPDAAEVAKQIAALKHSTAASDAFKHESEAIIANAHAAGMGDAFRLSAILGAIMGVFCFFLPHTPPKRGEKVFATWEARGEVQRNPTLMALFLFSIVISCVHQFYIMHAAGFLNLFQSKAEGFVKVVNRVFGAGGGGLMTIGQMSELVVLSLMPWASRRFSRKSLLTVGMCAYALRMALFAYVTWLADNTGVPEIAWLMLGVALHGVCFGCFIFVAFMVVDEECTGDVRASAQSLYNVVILGFGIIVGSKIASAIFDLSTMPNGEMDYVALFRWPMMATLLCLVVFLFLYPKRAVSERALPREAS